MSAQVAAARATSAGCRRTDGHQQNEIAAQREAYTAQRAAHAGGLGVTVSPLASAVTSRYARKWG